MTDRFAPTPEQLQDICAKHELWINAALGGVRANLSGAYLSGAYLSGANLRGADLRGAYLSGANLRGAYLSGAYLSGAYLRGAYLSDCVMNWQSHDLIAERLRQAAGDDAYKRLAAGYILVSRDWCWAGLANNVPEQVKDLLPWALSEMATWVRDGDDAPNIVKRTAKTINQE